MICVILISLALFVGWKKSAERIVVFGLALWLGYESVLGTMQLFGFAVSNNNMCPMTGSFANSGPYGGFLSTCIAVMLAAVWRLRKPENLYDKILLWLSVVSGCGGIIILPASMSRAGLVALAVTVVIFTLNQTEIRAVLKLHRWIVPSIAVLVVVVGICAFSLKKDSALGRFHIWEMEVLAIADKPLTGQGYGNALGAYGDAQAEYFESEVRSQERVRIAGCPEYAFNEYLRCGMEFGIPGLVLAFAITVVGIVLLYRGKSALACGLTAWSVFAMASYPLSVWQLRLLLAVFLGAAVGINLRLGKTTKFIIASCAAVLAALLFALWLPENIKKKDAENEWLEAQRDLKLEFYDGLSDRFALLYPQLNGNYRFLYDYGYALHKEGRYAESNEILRKGASVSSDPMFYNIIGKNFEAVGDYPEAERNYIHSHYMVPSRLYPYILLMEMKESQGDTEQALIYARKALSLPVNPKNRSMCDLHDRTKKYYDEHSEDI